MDLTPIIITSAVTALVTTLVTVGVTQGIPKLWKRIFTPRLEWEATKDTAGQWTLRRIGRSTALDTTYTLGFQQTNVTPQGGGRFSLGIVDVPRGGSDILPDVEWDEIGVSWIRRGRRVGVHAEVTDPRVRSIELRGATR